MSPDSGWQPIPLSDLIDPTSVRKAYKRAALCVHPDKLQQRGATVQQKYICEKVFDVLKVSFLTIRLFLLEPHTLVFFNVSSHAGCLEVARVNAR